MTTVSEIAQLGAKVLRQSAQKVNDVHGLEIQRIIETMRTTLMVSQGVGLAAPQISESKRIIIVASRPTARYPSAFLMEPTVMINPVFQALSDEQEKGWEGCLSIPGIRALVPRYKDILVHYTDEEGSSREVRLDGFIARIVQHEADHLDGKVYLDRVENNSDIIAESEYFKMF